MTGSREEVIHELEERRGTEHELEGFKPVGGRVSKSPRAVVSVRMSSQELRAITQAANALELNVSEFIRGAALKEARLASAGIEAARDVILARTKHDTSSEA